MTAPLLCRRLGCTRFGNPSTGYCFRCDPSTTDEQRDADERAEHRIERTEATRARETESGAK